jgi:hypothetical protein
MLAGKFQLMPASLPRGQAISNGFLSVLDCAHQWRPHKPDREPDKYGKCHRLRKKREVDIHG